MVYTEDKLKVMSDLEVNMAVAVEWLECDYMLSDTGEVILIDTKTFLGAFGEPEEKEVHCGSFNPCLDWNDVMPIAEKNGIGIMAYMHHAWFTNGKIESVNKNQRRAICEVFLMMDI